MFGYRLDYRTEVLGGVLGAHHSLDLPLVFDNADRSPTTGQRPQRFAVAAEMSSAWARFARTGNPAGGNVGGWQQYGPDRSVLVFGDSPTFEPSRELPATALGLTASDPAVAAGPDDGGTVSVEVGAATETVVR